MPTHTLGPSHPGSVVLDIGADSGALLIYTGPQLLHREIEISPADGPPVRTHAAVRERLAPAGVRYAAVYDRLRPGRYTVWADQDTPATTVTITGATITECHW